MHKSSMESIHIEMFSKHFLLNFDKHENIVFGAMNACHEIKGKGNKLCKNVVNMQNKMFSQC